MNLGGDGWPIYGVAGSEFEGVSIVIYGYGRALRISVRYYSTERYSRKMRNIRELLRSVIGPLEIRDFRESMEVEDIFPRLGDGA